MSDKEKPIAVLMGGRSAEREISLVSAQECTKALLAAGYRTVHGIDVSGDLAGLLANTGAEICFNALHGPMGEDGSIQGFLNVLGIPYTHSGVLASSIAMHKEHAKRIAQSAGIRCPSGSRHDRESFFSRRFDAPYVLKPINEGSSVHTYIVRDPSVPPVARDRWPYRVPALVEQLIEGVELTVTVLAGKALTVTEIIPSNEFYDYESKYAPGGSRHVLPARIPDAVFRCCLEWAEAMHNLIECRGISRSDFMFDERRGLEGLYFLEINTQPGMTPTSLAPEQAKHCGIEFPTLVSQLIACAATD
jgi:D-alanine-D-alanine ligase